MKLLLDATPSPVLEILLKWTVLLALGWAVHGLLRSKDARWRLILWRGIFCFGLAFPVLQFLPLPVVQIPIHHFAQSVPETPRVEPVTMPMEREPSSFRAVAAPVETTVEPAMRSVIQVAETVSWQTILIAIWAVGGVCGAVRLVWLMLQLGTLKRRARPAGATIEALAHETLQRFRVRRFVRVLVSDSAVSPFVFGVFKPTIMLPGKLVESLTPEEILALLGHETAHLSHNDLFWCVGWRWMKAVFWFHPLIWHIPAAHNLACEEEADRLASGQMGDDASYPQLLARLALRVLSIPKVETQLTANGTAQITQRLRHLGLDLGTWRRKHTVAAFGIVLALVLVSVGCKLTEARESDPRVGASTALQVAGTNAVTFKWSGTVADTAGKPVAGATVDRVEKTTTGTDGVVHDESVKPDPNAEVSAATKEYLRKPKFRIDLTPSSHVGDNDPTAREDMPLLLVRLANERYKGEMVDYVKVQLDLMWDKFPEYRSASREAALRIAAFWRTTGQSDDGTEEGSTRTNEIAALIWQTYHCLLADHHPLAPEVSRRKATQLQRLEEVLAHLEFKVARRKADLPKDALAAIRAEAQQCITRLHEYGGSSIWPLFYYPLQDAVFEKAINNMETDAQRNIDKYLEEYSAHRNMKWAELQGKALVSLTMGSIVRHYCLVERNLDYDDPTVFPFWKVTGAGCAYYMGSGLRLVMSID